MKSCAVFAGGIIEDYSIVDKKRLNDFLIISADAGYLHAKNAGLKTDIIVGDFDTLKTIPHDVGKVIKHNPEKDDTDTMLAVKTAIECGCEYIEIYGALGGRLDHSYANIQTLLFAESNGVKAKIISNREIIFIIQNETIRVERKENYSLSLFSLGDRCEGVTEKGVKYPLENAILTNDFPLGVCNEIQEDFAEITARQGKILVIQSKI